MNVWFTSDTHASHANIIRYSSRPFIDIEEMDTVLADNINRDVGVNDVLYHLGDWSAWRGEGTVKSFRKRIWCKNVHLIYGNHDKQIRKDRTLQSLFSSTNDILNITLAGHPIVLCHYAMRVWDKSHHGAWQLYGHSHGSLPDDPCALQLDVGVDTGLYGHSKYTPYSLEELRSIMKKNKQWQPIDHHTGKLAKYEQRERA